MAIVLKSLRPTDQSDAARHVSGLAGFNLDDFAEQGRQRLDACRQECEQLLTQVRQEGEQIHADAETRGYEAGLQRAEIDFEAKLREASETRARDQLQLLHQATEQLFRQYEAWMNDYAATLTSLSLAVAERVVGHRLDIERKLIVRWAEEALRSTRSASRLTVAVHPEILAELGRSLDELLSAPQLPEDTTLEADPALSRDDVVIRQNGGEIQAGLTAQLERLRETLT